MANTVVPQVIEALYGMFGAAVPSVDISVGPPPGGDTPAAYLAVGYGGDDREGITGSANSLNNHNFAEHSAEVFDVWCTISTASGDQDGFAQLQVTQAIYDACADALLADPQLGGVLKGESVASVGSFAWLIENGGEICTLFFTVRVDARWI